MMSLAGPILIATLWQGVALALLVALCLRVFPHTTAAIRFVLWTAALFLICFLPLVAMRRVAFTSTSPLPMLHADPRWSLALAVVWITLSLVRAADLVRHGLRLYALSRQAKPISVSPELAVLLSAHRSAQLCTSTQLDHPGVIGFFVPRILIPAWLLDQLTPPELEQIVLHELEHLRRHDDWLNLLQKVALVLFPLNPALYWIERRLCLERELACDEGVIARTRAPRLYATCLARLAEHGLDHRALSLALGFLERQSELARRVAGILQRPRILSTRQGLALTGTIAALLLGTSAEMSRCPQLISFTASPVALAATPSAVTLGPETWAASRGPASMLYTDAAAPRLVSAAFKQPHRPMRRKAKIHRIRPQALVQRASTVAPAAVEALARALSPVTPTLMPIAPTLVHYTLVPVEGGWLLLQL